MPMTQVKQHAWHHMTHTPVKVIGEWPDGGGLPAFIDTGEEHEGVSCMNCFMPYTPETAELPCEGEEEDEG